MTASTADRVQEKFEILDYVELPLDVVMPNVANPRPTFHLTEDDPELIQLADSIATEGQHRAVVAYELVGHYELPDQPGRFVLVQGERRFRACKIAERPFLRANLIRVPGSRAEELEWLSIEDGHRLPWQPFFEMQHAANLAAEYGISIQHQNIVAKTGLSMEQLRIAEKVFALDEDIQAMVAEYEQEMYRQRLSGKRKKQGRISGSGVRTLEFTPAKAAVVYDIFVALRQHMTLTVKDFDDKELQRRIAMWATNGATLEELTNLHSAVKQTGKDIPTGMLAKIHNLLQNPDVGVRSLVKTLGNSHLQRLNNTAKRISKIGNDAAVLSRKGEHFGHDVETLESIRSALVAASRNIDRLERTVTERIRMLDRHS